MHNMNPNIQTSGFPNNHFQIKKHASKYHFEKEIQCEDLPKMEKNIYILLLTKKMRSGGNHDESLNILYAKLNFYRK